VEGCLCKHDKQDQIVDNLNKGETLDPSNVQNGHGEEEKQAGAPLNHGHLRLKVIHETGLTAVVLVL
jgi:hypothetical protein